MSNRSFTAMAFILAVPLISIMGGSGIFGSGDDPPKWKLPELDQTQRETIIADANKALNKHLRMDRKKESPDDIDPAFWGTEISKMKPIRVRNDRVNVAIVLSVKDGTEEGLYVSIPISSYAPRTGDRFMLMRKLTTEKDRSFGVLYHYRLNTK